MNDSNQTLRFPRTRREAGMPDLPIDEERDPPWYAVVGWSCVGVMLTWLFLTIVLGWSP